MPDISFIIPIYCAEFYLNELIISLQNQTLKNWEAILIDDGSTDGSGAICDDICHKDLRFKVFHQKNQGVGAARNKGLELAQGRYIHFLDADDRLESNMAETVIEVANSVNADLVLFGSYEDIYDQNGKKIASTIISPPIVGVYQDNPSVRLFPKIATLFFVTRQLFRRRLIEESNCRFSNYKIGEDALFFVEFYKLKLQCIVGIDQPLYHYNVRPNNSASQSYHPERLSDNFYLSDAIELAVDEWKMNESEIHKKTVGICKVLDLQYGIKNICLSKLSIFEKVQWLYKAMTHAGIKEAVKRMRLVDAKSKNDKIKLILLKLHLYIGVILLSSLNNHSSN